ncbi:hypothetical protein scyTo_0009959 [Scyliorhinus torazame]|uniref:Uncharacterized protein n=1 Tax=Scyliorhinus torazame TaxID=75743 RepID=A0A401NX43_SCYTO|nr:hypothetical protein [Scyliorhinus torazame]
MGCHNLFVGITILFRFDLMVDSAELGTARSQRRFVFVCSHGNAKLHVYGIETPSVDLPQRGSDEFAHM